MGPTVPVSVNQIEVTRGETLTVWLNRADHGERMDRVQVELRVRGDGAPEMFFDADEVAVKSFNGWKSLESDDTA